ncbi:MAG: arsenosugar biosynthesis radical SAM protein ArsS [Dehalococcoidia bacterium]|nr:arsenosugar biosynthesis radical SAM protein ArsS [Dehalococcoidia bacterium]
MPAVLTKDKRYDFYDALVRHDLKLSPISIETLWANVTRLCNQACRHCHVDASPRRTEQMARKTVDRCLEILQRYEQIKNLDITGGAPELNPYYDYFVIEARKLKKHVVSRHNLTVIFDGNPANEERKEYLPAFFAEHQVEILASLPHYEARYTDSVRGRGVFQRSIEGIRLLNTVGYGKRETGLILNLVYNASGPVSPKQRAELETRYKEELSKYRLIFNKLYAVTNMPVNRFRAQLRRSGTYDEYMKNLIINFDPEAARGVACRSLVSVGYDGRIYDCDFNQMLGMQIINSRPMTVFDFDLEALINRKIRFGSHCFGCTAGGGGS